MQAFLSGLLVLILLVSGGLGNILDVVAPLIDFAHVHPGEQTAQILPPDTDGYLSINLRPGLSQLQKMDAVFSNWSDNPALQTQLEELLGGLEFDTGISINFEEDILPWLGPELALGVCHDPDFMRTEQAGPIHVLIVGTANRTQSDAFVFNKFR